MNPMQLSIYAQTGFVTMHNRIFVQFLWKTVYNRFCLRRSTVQHIANSAGAELDAGQTVNDLAEVLYRHHSLGTQNAYKSFQAVSVCNGSADTGRTLCGFLYAAAITFHDLVFDSFFSDLYINSIAGIVYL